ncbi:hypothetical protein BB934_35945 (plasmid) [Microvirga ossetica]|uniref:Uncharacterized protein n=2 Tax=Microvirga ossetica TaxID=1882682 RepID=A0A1B2EUK3_9HYPH|nr:hypothetical protein [Microvirga ossetica]ANY83647.1 hypothetical protein BB934_35945 [Microvirga ossetica]
MKDRISQDSFVEGVDCGVDFGTPNSGTQIGRVEMAVLLGTGSVATWLQPSRRGLPALGEMPNGSADSDAKGNADRDMIQSRA